MAHIEQREFCEYVKNKFPRYFKNVKVLDIGSLDINGCNRDFFENCDYTGIDVGEGKNVDVVAVGHLYDAPDDTYDVIISTEVFEHDMYYEKTVQNVMRMLKPNGLFLFTCAAPGRPVHGTVECGEHCAPLLRSISEEWGSYYKNLTPDDFRAIPGFNDAFVNDYFEIKNTDIEIPADLYYYGFKKPKYSQFNDDIFVIDCWTDTEEKEKVLIQLINKLKVYNCPILLCGHYPIKPEIVEMADYFLYTNDNDLLLNKDFEKFGVKSDRWTNLGSYIIVNKRPFHHDYAIWKTMDKAFKYVESLGYKYIHFLEYDNLPEEIQYRQAFMEYVRNNDAVVYEYEKDSIKSDNPYSATYIFSIRTETAIKTINTIKSKEEFFQNKPDSWQLEKNFYQSLKQVTNSIFVSKYIPNNNELNIFAAFNRNGILKANCRVQTYLGVDRNNKLYIHFISGFSEKPADKDYLVEINYGNHKEFFTVKKDEYHLGVLGEYIQNETVDVFYQGIQIFEQVLKDDVRVFRKNNQVIVANTNRKLNIHFVDGPFVEINEDVENEYKVQFINNDNGEIVYELNLKSNHWAKASIKYYVNWLIKIEGITCQFYHERKFDLKGKRVLICYETKSLGDTLGFFPYIDAFRKKHECEMICSTFNNDLFRKQYPKIEFVEPGTTTPNLYALYRLGMFYETKDGVRQYEKDKHPSDPKEQPLMKMASDILGLDWIELDPPKMKKLGKHKRKRVSIGVHSTAQAKYWNNPTGWQEVTDYLISKGYEVRLLSKEEDGYMGNKNPIGVVQQPPSDLDEIIKTIQESELFIGISSGLSWLAWAVGTPTIIISGFTDEKLEPTKNVTRIINKNVCNNCWGKFEFDPGDWNWCPEHKNTERQFECSKSITSQQVIEQIIKLIG
jgi:autotransporter strand-loop-strand O-heptosyltransferase